MEEEEEEKENSAKRNRENNISVVFILYIHIYVFLIYFIITLRIKYGVGFYHSLLLVALYIPYIDGYMLLLFETVDSNRCSFCLSISRPLHLEIDSMCQSV